MRNVERTKPFLAALGCLFGAVTFTCIALVETVSHRHRGLLVNDNAGGPLWFAGAACTAFVVFVALLRVARTPEATAQP
jgi:hypothetical protein